MKPKLVLITLQILSNMIPSNLCQQQDVNQTCMKPIICGNIMGIGHPFWGSGRPETCGHPGFDLECRDNILRLNISGLTYRVLDIDSTTQTLRVARDDLANTLCPPLPPLNTTLNSTLFDFSSTANDRNITISYGCSSTPSAAGAHNSFYCANSSQGFFHTAANNGTWSCNSSIYVPVSQMAAMALSNPGGPNAAPANLILQDALARGFSIQWSVNNDCRDCVQSGGLCEQSNQGPRSSFVCYCSDGPHNFTCNDNPGSKKGFSHLHNYIITGLSLGLASGIVLSSLFFYIAKKYRLRKQDQESHQDIEKVLLNHGSLAPKRFSYNEIKKITKSFKEKLGQGSYGVVYKGKLRNGQLVAIKLLTEPDNNAQDFINEVASISKTSHVNIVNLLGFCYESNKRALVYEYMPNRSLDNFISSKNGRDLEWEKLYEIAVGVARGLEYLHIGCNTRIVHFDIKPQNILLDEDFCPKISDFGLAKLFRKKQSILSMLGMRGTIGYIAPEVFSRSFGVVSHKSDVYSYGMMLLEMVGVKKIVETAGIESSEEFFHDRIYEHVLLENEKMESLMTEESEEVARKMLLVGVWCIQIAPPDRPSMTKVVEMLEGSVGTIRTPPKPFITTPMLSPQTSCSSSVATTMEIESSTEVGQLLKEKV